MYYVIFLNGDLFSGKIIFIKGIGKVLGIISVINLLMFMILKMY